MFAQPASEPPPCCCISGPLPPPHPPTLQALQRNPSYFHALHHLGLVLHLGGEHREAIQRLDAALQLQPRDWRVMEARGRVLQVRGRAGRAGWGRQRTAAHRDRPFPSYPRPPSL